MADISKSYYQAISAESSIDPAYDLRASRECCELRSHIDKVMTLGTLIAVRDFNESIEIKILVTRNLLV